MASEVEVRRAMDGTERIIDANLNRAREALRVMEDVARFHLNDPALSETLKVLRHDLRAAADRLPADRLRLVAHRDARGDVGATLTTMHEQSRESLRDVAIAGAARLAEALRSLEEAAKVVSADGAGSFERLRYRAYTAEKRLVASLGAGGCPQWRVCVLLTSAMCLHHPWERVAELAIDGGADCLQLREKDLPDAELLRRATWLLGAARARGVSVIVNDRPDIALLSGADGVHLGQDDLSVDHARRLAGGRLLVGVSTSRLDEARMAGVAGADYCGVGPMFATPTKPKAVRGTAYLREYLADPATAGRPHLAIGGVGPENIGALRDAGCRGVAVSASVCGATDPSAVCRLLRSAIDGGAGRA